MATPPAPGSVPVPPDQLQTWGEDRLGELVALAAAALPDERLSADELEAVCFHDGGALIGSSDGLAAVAAVRRSRVGAGPDDPGPGHIRFLAVDPRVQRAGRGRALLDAAHAWLLAHGADEILPGGGAPFYLWPGVDVRSMPALCLFESAGYVTEGTIFNLGIGVPLRPRPGPSASPCAGSSTTTKPQRWWPSPTRAPRAGKRSWCAASSTGAASPRSPTGGG